VERAGGRIEQETATFGAEQLTLYMNLATLGAGEFLWHGTPSDMVISPMVAQHSPSFVNHYLIEAAIPSTLTGAANLVPHAYPTNRYTEIDRV
jgi:hypothetical protein